MRTLVYAMGYTLSDLDEKENAPAPSEDDTEALSADEVVDAFVREMNIRMGAEVYRNQIKEPKVADDLTMYCLRHTFATDCARAGVPLETVRWLMGHADISTTANIYQNRDDTTLRAGISLLDGTGGKSGGNVQTGSR